jgi:hypothetical protein
MTNDQIPKKVQFPNSKLRQARFMHGLEIGTWDLFGVWSLDIGNLQRDFFGTWALAIGHSQRGFWPSTDH